MNTIVFLGNTSQVSQLLSKYKAYLVPSKNQYIKYLFKLDGATISVYTSGKIMIQGQSASEIAEQLNFPVENQKSSSTVKNIRQDIPLIGTDEVGNGSYFGGLAVVASFITPEQHPFLRNLGVDDSKKMTDQRMREIAPILKKKIQHQSLLLSPQKYNEVIASGYNAVSVKVALHNQAIYLLLKQGVKAEKIIIDAFTTPKNYEKYLKNEKNIVTQSVNLIEKAESQFFAVAVSSIIARVLFLDNLEELSQQSGFQLPSGAGKKTDQVASQILKKYGMDGLAATAKLHFKNTEKAKNLLRK